MPENQISKKIQKLLWERHLDAVTFCKKIPLSRAGFYQMLSNNSFRVETLQKIANALDVDIKYFFDDAGEFPSNYNDLKNEKESLEGLLIIEKNQSDLLYFMLSEMIHFVLAHTYYNELIENYVRATEYFKLQMTIAQRMKDHKTYKNGLYIPFDHDTVARIINSVLFEYPAIATAFEKKKIKNELLIKQYQEWKDNPPSYPEKD